MHFRADACFYFLGGQLFDSHELNDRPVRDLAIARCDLHGLAYINCLGPVHCVRPRTVSRAVRRPREQGPAAFIRSRVTNGRPLVIQDGQVRKRLAASLRSAARHLNVNFVNLRTLRNHIAGGRLLGLPSQSAALARRALPQTAQRPARPHRQSVTSGPSV